MSTSLNMEKKKLIIEKIDREIELLKQKYYEIYREKRIDENAQISTKTCIDSILITIELIKTLIETIIISSWFGDKMIKKIRKAIDEIADIYVTANKLPKTLDYIAFIEYAYLLYKLFSKFPISIPFVALPLNIKYFIYPDKKYYDKYFGFFALLMLFALYILCIL